VGKIDELYDRIYQLKVRKEGLERFRTIERDEYDQRIAELKKQIVLLRNPPPEKRILIDEIMRLRPDLSIIYTEPMVELGKHTIEQLQKHLEKCRKGYRFFNNTQIQRLRLAKAMKFGGKKVCSPSIKDLILKALKEKDHSLDELVALIKGNAQTIKATLTYHLKKQGYDIRSYKEGAVEKYKLHGYLDLTPKEETEEEMPEVKQAPTPVVEVKKVNYPKEGVFNFIVARLREKPHSITELVALTGAAASTIKQNLTYVAKNKGIIIVPIASAGYSELQYTLNNPTGV